MALTIANECRAAALNGLAALFNSGQFRLLTSGDSELAMPTFASTAFGSATTANPSVAAANALTADSSVTDGTVAKFDLRTSGGSSRIAGSVGTSGEDLNVTDNVIPETATSVNVTDFQLTLTLAGA